jgi:DDE superfamily endonuclease
LRRLVRAKQDADSHNAGRRGGQGLLGRGGVRLPAQRGVVARTPGLFWFRQELYGCLTARVDALFELTDAVSCTARPVTSLAELSLAAEHRRGHCALHDAASHGHVQLDRLWVGSTSSCMVAPG